MKIKKKLIIVLGGLLLSAVVSNASINNTELQEPEYKYETICGKTKSALGSYFGDGADGGLSLVRFDRNQRPVFDSEAQILSYVFVKNLDQVVFSATPIENIWNPNIDSPGFIGGSKSVFTTGQGPVCVKGKSKVLGLKPFVDKFGARTNKMEKFFAIEIEKFWQLSAYIEIADESGD